MKLLNISYIEIKKSKFYGYLYELDSIENVKIILNNLKEENKGYRHIPPSLWTVSVTLLAYFFTSSSAFPIAIPHPTVNNISISFLNNLERNNLNNHLIAVVRFYGGTKLGASNLSRTYGRCASTCINK